jgi:hypothetical protein
MTREEFLDDPNYHIFYCGTSVPDEWFVEAWETVPEFRENYSTTMAHDVSKGLGLRSAQIEGLARLLALSRMVELYLCLRNNDPWREPEFRPAFEEVFGERMSAFPPELTEAECQALAPEPSDDAGNEGIPF